MKITKLSAQVKNPDRVNVFLDGKYSFSLTIDQVLEYKVKKDLEIDEQDVKKFEKLSLDGKLRQRALEWLMIRPHSEKEVMDYFRRKKVDSEQARAWLDEFISRGYQSDQSFTRWWIDQRRAKQKSQQFIRQELRQKGVDTAIIQSLLLEESVNDKSALLMLIEKKQKQTKYQDSQKLTTYLLRQGYRYSDVVDALADKFA
jgi:regulatory protein